LRLIRGRKPHQPSGADAKDEFIQRVSAGKSFCDVGGLWGTVGEKVSVAHAAGAARLAMVDVEPEGTELWQSFDERMAAKGIAGVERISADINQGTFPDRFDVVHCSGVIYHSPNPLQTLGALRRLAGEHLILGSVVVPNEIRNDAGSISFAAGQALFLPHVDEATLAVVRRHLDEPGFQALGVNLPTEWRADDYGPWWWLFTASVLRQLLAATGFVVVDEAPYGGGKACAFLARSV
jgi:hypothetical protein